MTTISRPDVARLLDERRWLALREQLAAQPVPDIADLLLDAERQDRVLLYRLLPRDVAAEVFAYLEPSRAEGLLEDLTSEETRKLLAALAPDDRTELLEELPGRVTQQLLNLLDPSDLREARTLLGYPDESVGRLMTPDYVAVRADWTIERALRHIRAMGKRSETINVVYVVDRSWRLLDALELSRLILADPEEPIEAVMDRSYVALRATDDREKAVETIRRYDLFAVPVVDADGVLVGIVTVDDVFDVAEEEATEDFHKTAAVEPLVTRYREASVLSLWRRRIVWLVILVFVALLSSGVIAAFEQTLEAAIVLAFFIPLLIGSGGNTGAQSATLVVRAIATGDVRLPQWLRAVGKELVVGLSLGVAMGLASGVLGIIRGGLWVGLVVGISMALIVLTANLVGTILPFLLTRFGVDPAVASSPLIATIMDALGLLIYFTTATIVLGAVGEL